MKHLVILFLLIVSSSASAFLPAYASLIGLLHHCSGKDQVEVKISEGRLVLQIEDVRYPDLPECAGGYQTFLFEPGSVESADDVWNGFPALPLYLNKHCLAALAKSPNFSLKTLRQEIDIYEQFLRFDNGKEMIEEFEKGNLSFAVAAKATFNDECSVMFERTFSFAEAKAGKILVEKEECMSWGMGISPNR